MGVGHPEALPLSHRQVVECYEAWLQDPWGERREDYRNAAVRQQIMASTPSDKKRRIPSLDKLLLKFGSKLSSPVDNYKAMRDAHNASMRAKAKAKARTDRGKRGR